MKKSVLILLIVILLVGCLSGCGNTQRTDDKLGQIEKRLSELESQSAQGTGGENDDINKLKDQLAALQAALDAANSANDESKKLLEDQIAALQAALDAANSANDESKKLLEDQIAALKTTLESIDNGTNYFKTTVDGEGYILVNMNKTNVNVGAENAGKSAYNAFCENYPAYKRTEGEWLTDLMAGRLDDKKYVLMNQESGFFATATNGSANGGSLSNAVLELTEPVVLPLYENAKWKISFAGTLLPDSIQSGQFFASRTELNGRVYFGVNKINNTIFIGVHISDCWSNYCWNVSSSVMNGEHNYSVEYDGKELLLSIDGDEPLSLSSYNINQENFVSVDGKTASKEFMMKVKAVAGQDYLEMRYIGAPSHPCTMNFESFNVETTNIYSYSSDQAHALSDKTIFYLGSSVTRGHGGDTDGVSFAEMISVLTGAEYQKKTISGTNLAVSGGRNDSYVERFSEFDFAQTPDVLVLQLSTNDFFNGIPIGSVADGKALTDMNSSTITGAIETIIAKALVENPNIKIIVYTCPIDDTVDIYSQYSSYINGILSALQRKWEGDLYVLDLFNGDHINHIKYIQSDKLHPTKIGYAQLLTPAFINLIREITE